MFTWKQESVALRALISHPNTEQRVACVRQETGLSAAQTQELLAQAEKQQDARGTNTRTFYAVAFGVGEDMAGYMIALQAFMAAAGLWVGLYLLCFGQSFLGWVFLGLMVYLLVSMGAAYRQYQQHRAPGDLDEAIPQRG